MSEQLAAAHLLSNGWVGAVSSAVRTQSAGVSATLFNPRHYSTVYSVVPVRITVV
jgi:hypothetical protein